LRPGVASRCRGACELRRARRVVSPHEQPTSACAKAWRSRMVNEAAAYWGSGRSSSASARSAGSFPPGVRSQARIGLVAAGGLVQPPVFAARGGGQGGGELPCDAVAGEAREAGAPLGSVAADGLGEPDAGLLQRVVRRRRPGDRSARPAVRAAVGGRRSSRRKASSSPAWAAAIRRPRSRPSARALAAAIGRARRARGPRRPLLQRVVPSLTPGAPSCTRIGKRKAHHLPRR
jgi:hypothetical protein